MAVNPFEQFIPKKTKSSSLVSDSNMEAVSPTENPFESFIPKKVSEPNSSNSPLGPFPQLPGFAGLIQSILEKKGKTGKALGTAGEDISNIATSLPETIFDQIGKVPEYAEYLKENVPAATKLLQNNPSLAGKNALGGGLEFLGKVSRIPEHGINYLEHLGLINPETAQNFPKSFSKEEVSNYADKLIGQNESGGDLIRGLFRNAENVYAGGTLAKSYNPLGLTNKAIANKVLKERFRQENMHTKMYNSLWEEAKNNGIGAVKINDKALRQMSNPIKKHELEESWAPIQQFMKNKTLENAQKAQSTLNQIKRKYSEESKRRALDSKEKALYNAAKQSEKYIEDNMFKDSQGKLVSHLKDKYEKITNSYRENVVPYKYNKDIIDYKAQKKTPAELVSALKKGEFAVKKLSKHPEFKRQNILKAVASLLGAGELINIGKNGLPFMGNKGNNPF